MINHFIPMSRTARRSPVSGGQGQTVLPMVKSSGHSQRGARLGGALGSVRAEWKFLRPNTLHEE